MTTNWQAYQEQQVSEARHADWTARMDRHTAGLSAGECREIAANTNLRELEQYLDSLEMQPDPANSRAEIGLLAAGVILVACVAALVGFVVGCVVF